MIYKDFFKYKREDWIIVARRNYFNKVLSKKKNNVLPLTNKQNKEIVNFWKSICGSNKCTRLYNVDFY